MIKSAIGIGFRPYRLDWLNNCLKSFKDYNKYPIFLLSAPEKYNSFKYLIENINAEEILVLHDSCEIKDPIFIDTCFEKYKGRGVSLSSHPNFFGMNLGKYIKKYALEAKIPNDRAGAIASQTVEKQFNQRYCHIDKNFIQLWNDFIGSQNNNQGFEVKFGRKNMIVENKYLKKYKGHWNPQMYLNEEK